MNMSKNDVENRLIDILKESKRWERTECVTYRSCDECPVVKDNNGNCHVHHTIAQMFISSGVTIQV